MSRIGKLDRATWWESESLSLERLRQKLEWKPVWLCLLGEASGVGVRQSGEGVGAEDLKGFPLDSEQCAHVFPN